MISLRRRIYSSQALRERIGSRVVLAGWAQDIKLLGKLAFVILRDREGDIQLTFLKNFPELKNLTRESVIAVSGKVVKGKSKKYAKEVVVDSLEILSKAQTPIPIEFMSKSIETNLNKRLDWRCIDLRNPKHSAIFKIQSALIEGAFEWLRNNDYLIVNTPCIMGSPSESGADMFSIPYFGKKGYLRQDPQLHRQLTLAAGFDKIADIGPSWRAEKSHTIRHICEHRGIAVEAAFITNERDTMRIEEQLVIAMLRNVNKKFGRIVEIPKTPFPEITYPEIYKILERLGKKVKFGEEAPWECEKLLGDYIRKKYKNDFYFINRFPFKAKPFYVMRIDKDARWARSVDLIYKGIEQSSGGQREHRYDKLIQNIREKKMSLKSLEWFTKFFKYGVPPHGGFNIGIERLTMQLLDLPNIREAVLFPRDPERLSP